MKHKLATIGFSYLAGLVCASFLTSTAAFAAAGAFILATIPFALLKKTTAAVGAFTTGAALAVYAAFTVLVYDSVTSKIGQVVEVSGVVTDVNYIGNDLAVYETESEIDGVTTALSFFSSDAGAEIGDSVSFTAELTALSDNTNFAEKSYYKTKGVFVSAKLKSALVTEQNAGFNLKALVYGFNEHVCKQISVLLPNDEGDLLRAFFLGDKSGLSDELSDNIKYSGISHFAAVSGMHLTIVSHLLMLILGLTPLRNRRKTTFFILTALILLFMLFFKLSISVVRAGIMLIIFYGAAPLRRKNSTLNSMGLAALIILLLNPYACLDIGFLLSLAGTFGIGVVAPKIISALKSKRLLKVKTLLISSICPTLCTLPLVAAYFGGFSTVGVVMNLALYPFFLVAMFCVVIFVFLGGNGFAPIFVAGICAKPMLALIDFFANLKYSYIPFDSDFIVPAMLLSCVFVVAVYLLFKSVSRTAMAVGVSAVVICAAVTVQQYLLMDTAKVRIFSDGENACLFISAKTGAAVVATSDSPDICAEIKRFKKLNFVDEFSAVCILNSDYNNIGSFEKINTLYFNSEAKNIEIAIENLSDIKFSDSSCLINAGEFNAAISPVSEPESSDIMLLYGLKRSSPSFKDAGLVLYANKNIECDEDNEQSLYYDEFDLILR